MLGKRTPQGRLFATSTLLDDEQLDSMGIYGRLAREAHRIFRDEDFAPLYSAENGRPSTPPSLLATATMLQFLDGVSDAEVIERCRYDLRWKAALKLETHDLVAPFARSTFQLFRYRLILHEAEGQIFETSIRVARDAGLLPKKLLLSLDSSPVRGRGAVKDTYNLLSDAIKGVLGRIAEKEERAITEVAEEAGLTRHVSAPSIKGSVEMDWSSEDERRAFLAGLLADCAAVAALAEQAECGGDELKLIEQVIRQDVDEDPDGGGPPKIRRGVAKGRMPSVNDPEMRHGHKSSGKGYTGHKAHVAVSESGVIVDVDVTAPSQSEGSKVSEAIDASRAATGCEIDDVLGDCAYSTRNAQQQAEESNVALHTKMPGHRRGFFAPGDFSVSEDLTEAICPAGHASHTRQRLRDGHAHMWSPQVCGACPLRSGCTGASRRTLTVPTDFHVRRAKERDARSMEGRERIRQRVVVEHAIGRLKQRGAGQARYFGRKKTRLQWMMTAAAVNLCLVFGRASDQQARQAA
jgi:transposase